MPTPKKGPRLGGSPAHQRAILSNLATSLFEHGAITTTEAKARVLRPYAEKLITKAVRGDLHNRRQVASVIRSKTILHVLFTEIGPRYADRPGGYTRITKLGPRKGDNAPMAVIELVEAEFTAKTRATKKTTGATSAATAASASGEPDETTPAGSAAEVPADEETTEASQVEATTTPESEAAKAEQVEAQEAVAEQVEAQEAVAEQQPEGATVEPPDEVDKAEDPK